MHFAKNLLRVACLSSVLGLMGCAENPGTWGDEKVSAKVKESLNLTDVTLTAQTGGGFTGKGMLGEESITFTIQQDPAAHRMSWEAVGDRGFVEEGYYEVK
tara:strand:+ start:382 stop:684 length:303 start_codon:yes stop_codon:yes gene_type:complete